MKRLTQSPARRLRRSAAAIAVTALASGALAGPALLGSPAFASTAAHPAGKTAYSFQTLDNSSDPTFNQLLGINDHGVIAGYFGSGLSGHPNKGYLLKPPYGQANYVNENFPGSVQTQVTGLNDLGDTAGFWVNKAGTSRGFLEWNGVFSSYADPKTPAMKGSVNQLLGVNNKGIAVGFYVDAKGNMHAYELDQNTGIFTALKVPGGVSTAATGINNAGDIVGVSQDSSGVISSFLLAGSQLITYQFPGGSTTEAFGINASDEIVGSYLDGSDVMHGFTLSHPMGRSSGLASKFEPAAEPVLSRHGPRHRDRRGHRAHPGDTGQADLQP